MSYLEGSDPARSLSDYYPSWLDSLPATHLAAAVVPPGGRAARRYPLAKHFAASGLPLPAR